MYWVGWLRVRHSSEQRVADLLAIASLYSELQVVSEQNELLVYFKACLNQNYNVSANYFQVISN